MVSAYSQPALLGLTLALLCHSAVAQRHVSIVIPGQSQARVNSFLSSLDRLPVEYKAELTFSFLRQNWAYISPPKKQEILNHVFSGASSAHYAAPFWYEGSKRGSYASQIAGTVHGSNVDGLSIQIQVVRMARNDMPKFASASFGEIRLPDARASCEDAVVDNLSPYYTTLTLLMQDSRIKTIRGRVKSDFVIDLAREARDPEKMIPLISSLRDLGLDKRQMSTIISYIIENLNEMSASDREMKAITGRVPLDLSALIPKLHSMDIADNGLLAAYRQFLVRNLSESRCVNDSPDRSRIATSFNQLLSKDTSPTLLHRFEADLNQLLSTLNSVTEQSPQSLRVSELTPKKINGSAMDPVIPLDANMLTIVNRLSTARQARNLQIYKTGGPGTIEPEKADVNALLMYASSPLAVSAGCDSSCVFFSHAQIFVILIQTVPPGEQLNQAVLQGIKYLSYNREEIDDPPAFLTLLHALLAFGKSKSQNLQHVPTVTTNETEPLITESNERANLVSEELRSSADPIVKAYTAFDDIFHPSTNSPLGEE